MISNVFELPRVIPKTWKFDWRSAFVGAIVGGIITWVATTVWIARALVEAKISDQGAYMQICIANVGPLMADEAKAKEWCLDPVHRDGIAK